MSKDSQFQYWRDLYDLVRTKDDRAWILKHDPVQWKEWKWKLSYIRIGDWKWDLDYHPATPEEAKAFVKYAYDLDEVPE